jgi:hypothetical protein
VLNGHVLGLRGVPRHHFSWNHFCCLLGVMIQLHTDAYVSLDSPLSTRMRASSTITGWRCHICVTSLIQKYTVINTCCGYIERASRKMGRCVDGGCKAGGAGDRWWSSWVWPRRRFSAGDDISPPPFLSSSSAGGSSLGLRLTTTTLFCSLSSLLQHWLFAAFPLSLSKHSLLILARR